MVFTFPWRGGREDDSRGQGLLNTKQFLEMVACYEDPAEIWRWLLIAGY